MTYIKWNLTVLAVKFIEWSNWPTQSRKERIITSNLGFFLMNHQFDFNYKFNASASYTVLTAGRLRAATDIAGLKSGPIGIRILCSYTSFEV